LPAEAASDWRRVQQRRPDVACENKASWFPALL
jgi:hypothetical protein